MKKFLKHKDLISLFVILLSVFVFFYPFFLQNKLPIPADTVIGLYNPFRDLYAKEYPNGIPYKNFLITDPVRQQYVWKKLSIEMYKKGQLPLWNSYEMAGKPLLANFQSGVFYPLNVILFIQPFFMSWSFYIVLQMTLAGIFMYFYLKQLRVSTEARVLGSTTWIFSGFFIAWLEWGNIIHTVLWLPLILLSVHRIFESGNHKKEFMWLVVLLVGLCSAFFAGHLQSFIYIVIFIVPYILLLWFSQRHSLNKLFLLFLDFLIFVMISSIQWLPTLQFINLSGRMSDQSIISAGWFIPFENLIQFVAPDFFGNPSTLNYYGVFNYGEFIGYAGIVSLLLAIYGGIFRKDKKTYFFALAILLSLLFSTKNVISEIPFIFKFPLISSAQPTRLLFITCFSIAVLAAFGLDYFQKVKSRVFVPITVVGVAICVLWAATIFLPQLMPGPQEVSIAQSNLRLPTILFILFSLLLLAYEHINIKMARHVILFLLITFAVLDLLRFGWKYTPFVEKSYVFPNTQITTYLSRDPDLFRIAATDNQILPPNFATTYNISSIEGYDPLYLSNYASVIAANERSDHSISEPFGFNRIITPRNIETNLIDFLNVKYVLSFNELDSSRYAKVLEEGKTKLFENKNVLPRAFFVTNVMYVTDRQKVAQGMYNANLKNTAFSVGLKKDEKAYSQGTVKILEYDAGKIVLLTENKGVGFLVLSEVYYPTFKAKIDSKEVRIQQVNNAFRGIQIPKGSHVVTLTGGLF